MQKLPVTPKPTPAASAKPRHHRSPMISPANSSRRQQALPDLGRYKAVVRLNLTGSRPNIDALPDILRIAKANGWTSVRVNGGDTFSSLSRCGRARLTVENYAVKVARRGRLQRGCDAKRREAKNAMSKTRQPLTQQ
jgi:hypothetical protein